MKVPGHMHLVEVEKNLTIKGHVLDRTGDTESLGTINHSTVFQWCNRNRGHTNFVAIDNYCV